MLVMSNKWFAAVGSCNNELLHIGGEDEDCVLAIMAASVTK